MTTDRTTSTFGRVNWHLALAIALLAPVLVLTGIQLLQPTDVIEPPSQVEPEVLDDPWVEPPPDPLPSEPGILERRLSVPGSRARRSTIWKLAEAGNLSRAHLGLLTPIVDGPDARDAALAMWAITKIEGSRRYLPDLASIAAMRDGSFTRDLVLDLDPDCGGGLIAAARHEDRLSRESAATGLLEELRAVLKGLSENHSSGTAVLVEKLGEAKGEDLEVWVEIAGSLGLITEPLAEGLARKIRKGDPADRDLILRVFSRSRDRKLEDGEAILNALESCWDSSGELQRTWIVQAFGQLDPSHPAALKCLSDAVAGDTLSTDPALRILERCGPDASSLVPLLLRRYEESPRLQERIVRTLAGIGSPEALPLLLGAARDGTSVQQVRALAAIGRIEGAEKVLPELGGIVARGGHAEARAALLAMHRIDRAVEDDHTRGALVAALRDSRDTVRKAALDCAARSDPVPLDICRVVMDLGDELPLNRTRPLIQVLENAATLPSDDPEFMDWVVDLVRAGPSWAPAGLDQDEAVRRPVFLKLLARSGRLSDGARSACRDALAAPDSSTRLAALVAIATVADPTPADLDAVLAATRDSSTDVRSRARQILRHPAWAELRDR